MTERARGDGLTGSFDSSLGSAVVEVDEGGVWKLLTGAFANAGAHVEDGLKAGVGFQLGGTRLVNLPPELAVALKASGEAGFGEAVGGAGHGLLDSIGFRHAAQPDTLRRRMVAS